MSSTGPGLQTGETLLIQGGSSGIGVTAIQLAKAAGAKVIVTVGSDDKADACLALGADFAINYKEQDFAAEAKRLTDGRGVDVILDMVAGHYVERELSCLADDGRLVIIATQGGNDAKINSGQVLRRRSDDHRFDAASAPGCIQGGDREKPASDRLAVAGCRHRQTGDLQGLSGRPGCTGTRLDGIEPAHRKAGADMVTGAQPPSAPASSGRLKRVIGNWKMNGDRVANTDLLAELKKAGPWVAEVAVCVPFPYLGDVAMLLQGSRIGWGAQDCSAHENGAFTGEVAAAMLSEFACRYVLVGHSERRAIHGESDQLVADKAKRALAHGLTPVVCVGETLAERDSGSTEVVVKRQLSAVIHALGHCISQVVVAYEPVWAIGTGRTATPEQAQAVHACLRKQLQAATEKAGQMSLLYGGSVKPDNAAALFSQTDIDGGLIGGASLKAADFAAICRAAA